MNPDSPKQKNSSKFRFSDTYLPWIAHLLIFLGLVVLAFVFALQPALKDGNNRQNLNKSIVNPPKYSIGAKGNLAKTNSKDTSNAKSTNIITAPTYQEVDPAKLDTNARRDYWTINGTRGDFTAGVVGTIFSLGGFIYLLLSFKQQRDANKLQSEAFEHDKIETRIFELIKLHRDNVSELSFTYQTLAVVGKTFFDVETREKKYTQRQVFLGIKNQFDEAHNELAHLFDEIVLDKLYTPEYLAVLKENATLVSRDIELNKYAKMDLLYLIIFFGVSANGRETIKSITENKYQVNFVEKILGYAALKPKVDSFYFINWRKIMSLQNRDEFFDGVLLKRKKPEIQFPIKDANWLTVGDMWMKFDPYYPDNYEKYYGGHQFRLGHYFRHLYQSVSYINKLENVEGEQQRDWIRHLRGQLSTAEQILFFLNSLSQLGRIWELEDVKTGGAIDRKFQMITDYKLIKNIPNNFVGADVKLSDFYPGIIYEGFKVPQQTS